MVEKKTIYDQVKEVLYGRVNELVTPSDIKEQLFSQFGTNPGSVILSDYCYNRYNNGITFNKHLFQYIDRGFYKYLGEHYPFTGLIFHKPKGHDKEIIVGEWNDGEKVLFDNNELLISKEQVVKLYEQYNEILRLEMNILNCKPTELRHLIGRIGEFFCAIHTNGSLARETNQHGFDVIANGRKISVKTTAQTNSFITVNQNTFPQFDDFFVVQYVNDTFKIIYYGPKEDLLDISRSYDNKYEIDIHKLHNLYKKQQTQSLKPIS